MNDNDQGQEGTVEVSDDQQELPPQGHPAWQEILGVLPEEFHPLVMPTLEKWDKGVEEKINSLHSQYAEYDEYQPLIEEYEAEALSQAMFIAQAIQQDPRAVIEQIANAYNISLAEAQDVVEEAMSGQGATNEEYSDLPPEIQRQLAEQAAALEALQEQLAGFSQANEDAEAERIYTEFMGEMREAYGDFDEDYVVALIANGVDPEEAVQRYAEKFASQQQQPPASSQAPQVLGSGGNLPSNNIDPTKMGRTETADLVAQMLAQANQD